MKTSLPLACLLCTALLPRPAIAQTGAAGGHQPASLAPWVFVSDFDHGIPAWLSFPLAQDEGYDPSLYTTAGKGAALARNVTARGEKVLRVGLVRPLQFYATPASALQLSYALKMGGVERRAQVLFAATNGKAYTAAIPAALGLNNVRLSGRQLRLPIDGVAVDAVVIEVEIYGAIRGSNNRLILHAMKLSAERAARMEILAPDCSTSAASGIMVARDAVTSTKPLEINLGPGPAAQAEFYDGSGKLAASRRITASEHDRRLEFVPHGAPGLWSARFSSGGVRTQLRFLVIGKIPPHPRVLLTSKRLSEIASGANSRALLESVSREAARVAYGLAYNRNAGNNIALLSPDSVFPGLPQYFQLMETYSRTIALNALVYRLNGSSQALGIARKALSTVAAWTTWTPPWFSAHGLSTYYEVGVFSQRVAFGYDLIADRLTAAEKSAITQAFWRNSIEPTLRDYYFNDRLPTAASNHMANSVGGAVSACVALLGDLPAWNGRLETALAELITADESLLRGLFPGDGSEAEPAGYEDFAMEGMSWAAAALQSLGIRARGTERMLQAFWWPYYAQFKPGRFLDTGDFGGDLDALSGYAWAAENAGDPVLQAFYEGAVRRTLSGLSQVQHTGRSLEAAPGLLDLVCCTASSKPFPAPPPSRIFPLRGSAVMRSGWGPASTVISLRAGPWFNHEHHDEGSFQVAAFGEQLIAEAGYADYYKDPRYGNYFTQAPGHNSVLLDDDPFSQEDYDGRYWSALRRYPRFRDHVFSSGMDYISADLAPAYTDGPGLQKYVREYIFIKPDILVVHDQLAASSLYQYTFLVHPPSGDHVQISGRQVMIHGVHAFASLTAGGLNSQWTSERAPVPGIDYVNLDRDAVKPRQTLQLASPAEAATDFGVAMRFRKDLQTPSPFAAFKTISGFGFKSASGKTVVLIRTSPGMLVSRNTPFGGVSSSGDAAAITRREGLQDVLAVRADGLRLAGRLLFSVEPYTSKVDIVIQQEPAGENVHVACWKETNLQVRITRNPIDVTVDGARIPLLATNGFVSINHLGKGEHVVEIHY